MVIFGTPGLDPVFDVYDVLHQKIRSGSKPIYPVLPSVTTASKEVEEFLSRGHINFPDEVLLGDAITRIYNTEAPAGSKPYLDGIDIQAIREVINGSSDGYLSPEAIQQILDAGGIPRVKEGVAMDEESLGKISQEIGYPLVMKVIGPVHKSDVGGVILGIENDIDLADHFQQMKKIEGTTGVLLQPMLSGLELFAGAKYEPNFGHVVLCGLGGIYVEVMKDVASGLAPLSMTEASRMIRSLKGYKMLKGIRGQSGIDVQSYAEIIVRLSSILRYATEIAELDLNPIIGNKHELAVVDARIRIKKSVV